MNKMKMVNGNNQRMKKMNKEFKARKKLLNMLTYCRPEGSQTQKDFCVRFIEPLMGKPDEFGNYILINNNLNSESEIPNIAFMAHHDTVHTSGGLQKLEVFTGKSPEGIFDCVMSNSNCLGADCTTGVWLILEMIKANVPGVYIIHAGEEIGGIGSGSLVKSEPEFLFKLDFAISFDRYGTNSIITHQSGLRCCSESFSSDLESILNLNLKSDSGGTYTDSAEYTEYVSECTNISVGYYNQHTTKEYQNIDFALTLRERLINAEWNKLKPYRDPSVSEFDYYNGSYGRGTSYLNYDKYDSWYDYEDNCGVKYPSDNTGIKRLVKDYPTAIAALLEDWGLNEKDLKEHIQSFYGKDTIAF